MTEMERPLEDNVFDGSVVELPPIEVFKAEEPKEGDAAAEAPREELPKPVEIKPDEPKDVVGIRFQRAGRVYYFAPAGLDPKVGDQVVAETERGLKIGRTVIAPKQVMASQLTEPLKPVLRLATPEDLGRLEGVRVREREALS